MSELKRLAKITAVFAFFLLVVIPAYGQTRETKNRKGKRTRNASRMTSDVSTTQPTAITGAASSVPAILLTRQNRTAPPAATRTMTAAVTTNTAFSQVSDGAIGEKAVIPSIVLAPPTSPTTTTSTNTSTTTTTTKTLQAPSAPRLIN